MEFLSYAEFPTVVVTEHNYNVLAKMNNDLLTFSVVTANKRTKMYLEDVIIALGGKLCTINTPPTFVIAHGKLDYKDALKDVKKDTILTSQFVVVSANMNKLANPSEFRYFPPGADSDVFDLDENFSPQTGEDEGPSPNEKAPDMQLNQGSSASPLVETTAVLSATASIDQQGFAAQSKTHSESPEIEFIAEVRTRTQFQGSKQTMTGSGSRFDSRSSASPDLPLKSHPKTGRKLPSTVINIFLDEIKNKNLYGRISSNSMYSAIILEKKLKVSRDSIRNFFLRTFPKNLGKYARTPEEKNRWRVFYEAKKNSEKQKLERMQPFSKVEGHALLKLVLDAHAEEHVMGNAIYHIIVKKEIFKNRTWSSVRNFMVKLALKRLNDYEEFPDEFEKYKTVLEAKKHLPNSRRATPKSVLEKIASISV